MAELLDAAVKNIYTTSTVYPWSMRCVDVKRVPEFDTIDDEAYQVEVEIVPNDGRPYETQTDLFMLPKIIRGSVKVKGKVKQGFYTALGNPVIRIGTSFFQWGHAYSGTQVADVKWRNEDHFRLTSPYDAVNKMKGVVMYEISLINLIKYFGLWTPALVVYFNEELLEKAEEKEEKEFELIPEIIDYCEIPESALRKLRFLAKNPNLPNKLTKEVIEAFLYIMKHASVLAEQPTPMDYRFLDTYEALAEELKRAQIIRQIRFGTTFKIQKNGRFSCKDLQKVIGNFMSNKRDPDSKRDANAGAGSMEFSNIQSSTDTNALSVAEQNSKIYFESWAKGEHGGGSYAKQRVNPTFFVGFIDPVFTADGAMVNIKNELSKDAVIKDGEAYIKLYDMNFKEVTVPIYDYLMSKTLSGDNVDYYNKKVFPVKGQYSVYEFGEYTKTDDLSSIKYIRKPDGLLTTSMAVIPFINKTQSMRAMLGAHMYTQALPVIGSQPGFVYTGEGKKVYDETALNESSPIDGKVVAMTDDFMKIENANETRILKRPESYLTSDHSTNTFRASVSVGDKVKKGQTIYECNSFKDKELSLGVPLYTAFMSYHSYEHEDAVVMSESAAKKFGHESIYDVRIPIYSVEQLRVGKEVIESVDELRPDSDKFDEIGLIRPGTYVKRNDPLFAYEKILNSRDSELAKITELLGSDKRPVDVIIWRCPFEIEEGTVESTNFIPVKNYMDYMNRESYSKICNKFGEQNKNYRDSQAAALGVSSSSMKEWAIQGVKFEDERVIGEISVRIRYINKLKTTDKVSNLFGGKGVNSKLIPDEQMVRDSKGKPFEIIMSPLAVISRINISQLYVSNLGLISKNLYERLNAFFMEGGKDEKEREILTKVIRTVLYETPNISLEEVYEKSKPYGFVRIKAGSFDKYFTSDLLEEVLKEMGISEYEQVYDPMTGRHVRNPVRVGYQEFIRLHFIAENKMKATGTIKSINVKGYGGSRAQGQKIGEMEAEALMAHGEQGLLQKFSYEKDDKASRFFQDALSIGLLLNKN